MQETSMEEAMGPNVFKSYCLCVAGVQYGKLTETVVQKEKEQTLKSTQEMKEHDH